MDCLDFLKAFDKVSDSRFLREINDYWVGEMNAAVD